MRVYHFSFIVSSFFDLIIHKLPRMPINAARKRLLADRGIAAFFNGWVTPVNLPSLLSDEATVSGVICGNINLGVWNVYSFENAQLYAACKG